MHEAYEDAVESGSDGFSGIIGMLVFFGIFWVVSKIYDSYKEDKKRNEQIKLDRELSAKVASSIIQKNPNISKYQSRESWQKGFANATYDISHNKVKELLGKSIDELIQEYRHQCEMGHMIQAESIMEQIGYFQKIEFNKKQIESEHNAKDSSLIDSKAPILMDSIKPTIELGPIETEEFIISYDKKVLIKGKDVPIIRIPQGVETIQSYAFDNLKQIKEVIIPEGVKEIGEWAFNFSSIETIIIPSSMEKIGENAFYYCNNLRNVIIKDGVKSLGIGMFSRCKKLNKVSLPSSILAIPDYCFEGCTSLVKITLPNNLQYIGDDAFCNCHSLCDIIIPKSVTDIGIEAFRQCYELKSIIIPSKVVGISEYMFYDDFQLKHVELSDNLTSIMSHAFGNCTSLEIRLPMSILHIEKDAFSQCKELHLLVPLEKKEWVESHCEDVKGHIYAYDGKTGADWDSAPEEAGTLLTMQS